MERDSGQLFDVSFFAGVDRLQLDPVKLRLDELVSTLSTFAQLKDKRHARVWSPTRYLPNAHSRGNVSVSQLSCLVFDLDRVPPDHRRLESICWIAHTTWSHCPEKPRWRLVLPLAQAVDASEWKGVWQLARSVLCPEADPACKDVSRAYWLPSHQPGSLPEAVYHLGSLLTVNNLPPPEPDRHVPRSRPTYGQGHSEAYMRRVLGNLAAANPGGRNAALNRAARSLGRLIATGALEQTLVEDGLYQAARANGVFVDDGERQTWATIRSGLNAGLRYSNSQFEA